MTTDSKKNFEMRNATTGKKNVSLCDMINATAGNKEMCYFVT